ncbi:T9SS C-terminal target domain-containing protein [Bacteroidetes/Chlorobi group bacterium ChocPot_Mid]|nr:MAG: T9SS C-terminal target domain-containing protein [Bacteroidetes/Chlorobi group bacterium ChocPot_Mid]
MHDIGDSQGNILDSIQCGNGYIADFHEFQILPNGHYFINAWESVMMDLSEKYNANPSSRVIGTIYQELDAQKNVVFQWRSLDQMSLDDFVPYALQANTFDQARGNSGFPDWDGNYIFSFPTTNEIVKVSRTTGEFIWRLGGKHNEFTFINEHPENAPNYFNFQHYAHRLPNGNLLLFDNGIRKTPAYSRAVEYELDEVNKTCKLVWEYRNNPDITTSFGGAAQRLANGNTLISWALVGSKHQRTLSEVTPNNEVVFELSLPSYLLSYRSYKFDTNMCQPVASVMLEEVLEGNNYTFNKDGKETGVKVNFERMDSFIYNFMVVKRYECPPVNCDFVGKAPVLYPMRYEITTQFIGDFKCYVSFDTKILASVKKPESAVVYYRDSIGQGKFIPVATEYDAETSELKFVAYNKFGEYVIGFPYETRQALTPKLTSPKNGENVNGTLPVQLKWSLIGYARSSDLVVATDPNFENIVKDEKGLLSSLKKYDDFEMGKTYYWKTRGENEDGKSGWSDVWSFTLKEPYIKMLRPNGGEHFVNDTTKNIIRWEKNTMDTVRIELYKGGVFHSVIRDTFFTTTNAYAWVIPKMIAEGSDYKIRVTSISKPTFSTMSENEFSIGPVGVEEDYNSGEIISIYPNPAEDEAYIDFSIKKTEHISIKLLDITGKEKVVLANKFLDKGNYRINFGTGDLTSGIYIVQLQTSKGVSTHKISVMK